MQYDGIVMTQHKGICIGSAVVPFLADLYLNTLDQKGTALTNESEPGTLLIARYVDEIFVCSTDGKRLHEVRRNLFQMLQF